MMGGARGGLFGGAVAKQNGSRVNVGIMARA